MAIETIKAKTLSDMFLGGARNIEAKKEYINELNVFPVPDGDTGTNMSLTIMAAAREVSGLESVTMKTLAKAISSGSLRGARGNSGVILSQLFRGFTNGIKEYEELNDAIVAGAFQKAVETAYKAVMKPKEGTILTVARGMADKAGELVGTTDDLAEFFRLIIEHGEVVLEQTPELLPVLKEAGVVDSGGEGLMTILHGAYDVMMGKEIDYSAIEAVKSPGVTKISAETEADIKFGYCTEFIIMLEQEFDLDTEMQFKEFLESIGDSIVCVADDEVVKVHVHTNDPGLAIQKALTFGPLTSMKIDNMREEHEEKLIKDAEKVAAQQKAEDEARKAQAKAASQPRKETGFISVSIGDGINEIFKGLGVDYLIEGGQTMNPSTDDMLQAIDKVNADNIFIFPNNKNIILAANQAQALVKDKNIIVIPTSTIPQGITAIINFVPDKTVEENEASMLEEIKRVKTGQVTYAVRDTTLDEKEIHQGDIMGIGDHAILSVGESIEETAKDMISQLVDEESELISVYFGADVEAETAERLGDELEEAYPECDIEVHSGGQPIYYYVMSVE